MSRPALVLFVLLLMFTASAQAAVGPRLEKALATEDFVWQAEDGTYTVWVFFKDKGLSGSQLDRALDAAEANLNEKTAWRRSKVTTSGQRLTDTGDLDLHAPYLDLVRATGADLRRQSRWLNAASFQASGEQIRQLAQLECVLKVDLVSKFKRPALPANPVERSADKNETSRGDIDYGGNLGAMEQFNVPEVHAMGINGQGVIIGMLDTGFHTAHEALTDIPVIAAYDFLNDDDNVDNEPGDPSNAKNHGTMTMSTAVGYKPGNHVAPAFGASVVLAKTESVDLEIPIEEDNWVAGMEWVESHGADIVSSSLGYTDWYTWEDMDGATAVTTIAADLAVTRGMVVVNSAGNDRGTDWNHIIAPSDGFNVITVGAVTSSGNYTSFSSPGPSYDGRTKPDVAALGSSNHVADPNNDTGYTNASGTSFSCPLTSGVVALILSRAPSLTPMQVRDALRETASQAQAPDNDYGWGLIDAHAAVTYFGPNFSHTPLPDTEDTMGPYGLGMMITDRIGLDDSTTKVWYRANGGPWQETPIWPTGGGPVSYFADIPGQPADTVVDYYLEASSLNDITTRLPDLAPAEFFSFRVGQDVTPPELTHTPLRDQALIQWPPTVFCQVTDNLGVDRVEMSFTHNGGPDLGPYLLDNLGLGVFALEFPLPAQEVTYGDVLSYTLTATDGAANPNTTLSGPNSFQVIETLGLVLILDDSPGTVLDVKIDDSQKDKPQIPPVAGKSSSGTIAAWLLDAGYVADVIPAAGVTEADFEGYDVVILSAGNNSSPVADAGLRQALQGRAAAGGKILIEGGEVGYDALNYPGYPDFASQVLHGVNWDSDNAGDLAVATGMANHPLVNTPHLLPFQILLDFEVYGDEDAVKPAADAYTVLVPLSHQGDGGIIIFDDNPAPQSAQILYLAFNVEAIELSVAPQLMENAVAYLMAQESPPTSALSGRVTLSGQEDHSGVLVDLGEGHTAVTTADGLWSFTDLYAGNYSVVATKEGWSADRRDIVLEDGQLVSGVNFTLSPILVTEYRVFPNLTIPDGSPSGVTTTITVPESESGPVANVSVDVYIQHEWIGDLTVVLSSPQGTSVVLHNRSGGEDTNILGNWPETRPVDGPGTLEDFLGENNAGVWTLFLSDAVNTDEGQLTMWGLNFSIPQAVSAVPDALLPALTRLHPNVPNPFNPATEIRFDLAKSGKVQLDIFDVRGRRVRRLVDEQMPAGMHGLRWDGRDASGRTVSSGTYLYRLRAGDVVQERKMLLVR